MVPNRASDIRQLIGDLKQKKKYAIVGVRFFSVVEIPVKHSNLHNN